MTKPKGKTKIKENRGTGNGSDYKPWILTRELSSEGTKSEFPDWKHGRTIHTLSRCETYAYYILRWNDSVIDIREQYPLDRETTQKIADLLDVRHPTPQNDEDERMTTDFLITYKDQSGKIKHYAVSIKSNDAVLSGDPGNKDTARHIKEQYIEMTYWHLKKVPFIILFGNKDINEVYARNIEVAVQHYALASIKSVDDFMLYLIAHKYIQIDMKERYLSDMYQEIMQKYCGSREQINEWLKKVIADNISNAQLDDLKLPFDS